MTNVLNVRITSFGHVKSSYTLTGEWDRGTCTLSLDLAKLCQSKAELFLQGGSSGISAEIKWHVPLVSLTKLRKLFQMEPLPLTIKVEKKNAFWRVHFYSRQLKDEIIHEFVTKINQHSFVEDKTLIVAHADTLNLERIKIFQGIIKGTRTHPEWSIAAANAITVLNQAGVSFDNKNLEDIKISGADLTNVVFRRTRLRGADLRTTTLKGAYLEQAVLYESYLKGVNFKQQSSLYHTELPLIGPKEPMVFLYDNDYFISADRHIYIWDPLTLTTKQIFKRYSDDCIAFLALTSSHKWLISASEWSLGIWGLNPYLACEEEMKVENYQIIGIKISEKHLAVWGKKFDESYTLCLYCLVEQEENMIIEPLPKTDHEKVPILDVTLSEDGSQLIAVYPNEIQIKDITTWQTIKRIPLEELGHRYLFSPNKRQLVCLKEHKIYLIDFYKEAKPLQIEEENFNITHISFSNDGKFLLYVVNSTAVCLYNLRRKRPLFRSEVSLEPLISLAYAEDSFIFADISRRISLQPLEEGYLMEKSLTGYITHVSFNGMYVSLWINSGVILRYEKATGKMKDQSTEEEKQQIFSEVKALLQTDNTERLTSLLSAYFPLLSPTYFRDLEFIYLHKEKNIIKAIAMSADRSYIAYLICNKKIVIWDFKHTEMIEELSVDFELDTSDEDTDFLMTLSGTEKSLTLALAFNPFNSKVMPCIYVWEMELEGKAKPLTTKSWKIEHNMGVSIKAILFSHTSSYLLVCTVQDNAIRKWDISKKKPVLEFYHIDSIISFEICREHRWLITTSRDKTIRFWDLANGSLLYSLKINHDIQQIELAPEGTHLAIWGTGSFSLWELDIIEKTSHPNPRLLWRFPHLLEARNAILHPKGHKTNSFIDDLGEGNRKLLIQKGAKDK
ncbi:pentapeptide repeat-containing protein [Neochlamydia sp. S13]|uniref:WD40 repeat domain-containing protein n=1 Tax=Neochlamydia sp. S13 TaxID=1353976 RepID=UPI0005A6FC45|nr:pentapeptide repeat-containing protein [Neochlamydia sp. S13]BBI17726.1 hypothetical protein NCS13_1_1531 [Neochlamydia sp. S13]